MKHICVFLSRAYYYKGDPNIHWIVCKECERKLRAGTHASHLVKPEPPVQV